MIKISSDPFKLNVQSKIFVKLASPRRTQIVFFPNALPKTDMYLDIEGKKAYSSECVFYPILNSVSAIVGSLYIVNRKKLNYTPTMFYVRETAELGTMEGEQTQGVGGTLVFSDEERNVMVVPSTPVITDLTVLE